MLDALKFVQGAIQRNGIAPELEHFIIRGGRVTGFNGYMALSAPLPLEIEAMPKAVTFHKALQACGDTVAIALTPAGRLHIQSGRFSAYIPCIEKVVYEAQPQGERFPAPPGLAATCARMLPFIGDDASRPWAMGMAIGNGCYTATNNVILIQVWDGNELPVVNCPRFAVAEVARLKVDPVEIQTDGSSLSFLYPNGRWLRTQVIAQEWPVEKMSTILDRPAQPSPVAEGLFDAVDQLVPFVEEGPSSPVFFEEGRLSTADKGSHEGAAIEVPGIPAGLAFRLKALQLLRHEMQRVDFSISPALFYGERSRGALIGMAF